MLILLPLAAIAEDVEKKFRISLSAGALDGWDVISSDAANALNLRTPEQTFSSRYEDPRNDSAVFGELTLNPSAYTSFKLQYAVNKVFLIEASAGYQKTNLGDVEVQAQFQAPDFFATNLNFDFKAFRVPVGDVERIPLQLSGIIRFRPRAAFNPYIGGGIGYSLIGFSPSDEFNTLSINLDSAQGAQGRLTPSACLSGCSPQLVASGVPVLDLTGMDVEIGDTFEMHVLSGGEYTFKSKWAVFMELSFSKSSRQVNIVVNGGDYLGVPVPNITDFQTSELSRRTYGAVWIPGPGLVDGGSWQPTLLAPPDTSCDINVSLTNCEFKAGDEYKDGDLDPGWYYVQGGKLDSDFYTVQFGIRYTF